MKTVLEVLNLSTDHLTKKGIQQARRQAEELIADALSLNRLELYTQFDKPLTDDELKRCREYLGRRALKEPLQYIRGFVEFYGCKIKVNQDVLIPRQETEIFVDKIAAEVKKQGSVGKVFFDVCAGSGCVGIALKKKFPDLTVVLSDISIKALGLARENALQNGVEVETVLGDLLQPLRGRKCDYFFCNPPYIAEKEYENLEPEVKLFEPKLALISGFTGLEFYEKLSQELPGFLKNLAHLFLEIGHAQGTAVSNLFSSAPWKNCRIEKDWSSHDRFFFLEIE